jgi:nucleotide-binding universal stress UspA family protein
MSIFPTRILLATDGSPDAALALETAVDIANATNSELHVVTAARGEPAYDIRIEEVAEQLRQEAQEVLDKQVRRIGELGGTVKEAHIYNPPHSTAERFAKRFERSFLWARRSFLLALVTLVVFLATDQVFELFRASMDLDK